MAKKTKQERIVKLVNRRCIFTNSVWHVAVDEVEDSRSGARVEDYVVLNPLNRRTDHLTGVTVLPILDGNILLLRNYRHPVERFQWEAARGFIDVGEEPRIAALREVSEETGLVPNPDSLLELGLCYPEASTMIACAALFAVDGSIVDMSVRDGSEPGLGDVFSFTVNEVESMLMHFEIEDATTAIACERYIRYRRVADK